MVITNRSLFYAEARQFVAGLALHEEQLGVITAICPVAALSDLYGVGRTRQQSFQQARDSKRDAYQTQREARATARAFVSKARDTLVPYLGAQWSESWTPAGFIKHSLAVPPSVPRLIDTLEALEQYFTANPSQQNAALNVSAQAAKQTRENLELAVSTVRGCKRQQRTNRDARATADSALAEKLAAGRKVLTAVLSQDDPRWLDFRADVPSDLSRPEGVEGVEWEPGLPGRITLRWPAAVRGESYVVQVQVVGKDDTFRNVATVRDTLAELSVTPGAHVKVRVIARNASGPAVPSEEVEAIVPALAAAA